jgi:hypothetical protein
MFGKFKEFLGKMPGILIHHQFYFCIYYMELQSRHCYRKSKEVYFVASLLQSKC